MPPQAYMVPKYPSLNRGKVWNFNDQEGWEKFRELTRAPTSVKNYVRKNGDHPEIYYQRWGGEDCIQFYLNCFKKKKHKNTSEPIYNKQIRNLIKERKILNEKEIFKRGR